MSDYPGYSSPNAPQEGSDGVPPPQQGPGGSPPEPYGTPHQGGPPAPYGTPQQGGPPPPYGTPQQGGPPPPYGSAHEPPQKKRGNTIGMIALIAAIVGFILALIPATLIVGGILLPIAFVLSIVGLAQSGKPKGTSIAAIILSIVGFIVGALVFLFVVTSAVDDAFSEADAEIVAPGDEDSEGDSSDEDVMEGEGDVAEGDEGSRSNPASLGSTIRGEEWDVTILGFDADATDEVLEANEFNDEPSDGNVYALIEAEVTYTGDESETPWLEIGFAYVTEGGNTLNDYDNDAVAPSPQFSDIGELYEGASDSGYVVFEIPEGDDGLLRVEPGFFADGVFVAIN